MSARSFASGQAVPQVDKDARVLKTTFNLPDPDTMKSSHQLTKIVATIGPTSEQEEPLRKVVNAGMKIMRLNFSHATTDEVELRLKNLATSQVSPTICLSVFLDEKGLGPFLWLEIFEQSIWFIS